MTKDWKSVLMALWVCIALCLMGCDDADKDEQDLEPTDNNSTYTGEETGEQDTGDDTEAPTVSIETLTAFTGVSGTAQITVTAEDNVAVAQVELLVNEDVVGSLTETPFVFEWDTTRSNDGPVDLSVSATDTAGNSATSEVVRVVIVNDGKEVLDLEEGSQSTMVIPPDYDGTQETHIKRHFTPLENYVRVLCVAMWENPVGGTAWNMKAEMGTGTCPHSGISFEGDAISDTGVVELDIIPEVGVVSGERHYCHIGAENSESHVGEEVDLTNKIFVFGETADMTPCPPNSAFRSLRLLWGLQGRSEFGLPLRRGLRGRR